MNIVGKCVLTMDLKSSINLTLFGFPNRYRRQLRAIEDGVTETISIVPKLNRENPRSPPPNTLPDLVMFCRRVYEFRLKRLLKQPN